MTPQNTLDVIVIGAGPAGLLAAGRAAGLGARVLLLEGMEKPARKLRISGKGRCNITSLRPLDQFLAAVAPEPEFLRPALEAFTSRDIIALIEGQGVPTVLERGERVFPASGKAWDVATALQRWAQAQGAAIECHARVTQLHHTAQGIAGVQYVSGSGRVDRRCRAVVLATGGMSYPATGSTGDGYRLAAECGHRITRLRPSLVGLRTAPSLRGAEGLTLRNVSLKLAANGQAMASEFGELEITPTGLSGPIALRLSRQAVDLLHQGLSPTLSIDLKPALSLEKLGQRVGRELEGSPHLSLRELLRKLLPAPLVGVLLEHTGLAAQKPYGRLQALERLMALQWIKGIPLRVTGHGDWPEAIITAGGVALGEVNPLTMESRRVRGLHFAGELLDLDGPTGGFNLQIAYSTGWLAGTHAARAPLADKKIEH